MRIPDRGVYGPLISAVSVVSGELFTWMSLFCHFKDAVFLRAPLRSLLLDESSNQVPWFPTEM